VYLFNKLRNNKVGKHKWIRNNASTMTSQAVDTVIFITIAFFGTGANLLVMMASQFVVKIVIALLDTPIFYLLTKGSRNRIQSNDGFGYRSELIQIHHIPALLQE